MLFLVIFPLVFCCFEGRIFWRGRSSSYMSAQNSNADIVEDAVADTPKRKKSRGLFSRFFKSKKRRTIVIEEIPQETLLTQEEKNNEEEAEISVSEENIAVAEENQNILVENEHLTDLVKREISEGRLENAIDCLIALILNSRTDREEQAKKKECISLCKKSDSKSRKLLVLAEAFQYGKTSDDKEKLFEKARKYTAKREYSKARDLLLSLYLIEEDLEKKFDRIYRCGMISLKERKPYLARGFFTKAIELINKNDRRWPELMLRIAVCEDMIGRKPDRPKQIILEVFSHYPNYKAKTEQERKFIVRFIGEEE